MTSNVDEARECVLDVVLGAITLDEITHARQVLHAWMKAHPEEEGMRHGFEQLSLMEDAANMQEAERCQQKVKTA